MVCVSYPLPRIFGVRVLEDVLEWQPDPGESPLSIEEVAELRAGLRALIPTLLARIRVERTDLRDKRVLIEFAERLEPVDDLRLTCSLDGVNLDRLAARPYFVKPPVRDEPLQAFVVWEGRPWPPTAETAQGVAMALADALGVNLVETFLAFIQSDQGQRKRLLDIAGASGFAAEIADELSDANSDEEMTSTEGGVSPTAAPEADIESEEKAAQQPIGPSPAAPPIPLFRFEDLTIDGEPFLVFGEQLGARENHGPGKPGDGSTTSGQHGRASPGTDLAELDLLGMRIAMGYEVRRLRRQGQSTAEVVPSEGGPVDGESLVVDVHSPETIRRAEASSSVVKHVMADLESRGISRLFPGFDILSIVAGKAERLIELKSSGVDARVQTMSWNEWKSARASDIRQRFWLYLVGNLRADLGVAQPFVRTINDPFGSLASQEIEEHHVSRAVQLRVREFKEAEQLNLGVDNETPK